jgi:prepilin-type N-terminal cleavage/methylation domain-containing protein
MNCHRTERSAFTLLEMLVAMALMSVLAGSLYSSLHISYRARDVALRTIQPARTAELALDMIRREIESALVPTGLLALEFLGEDNVDEFGRDADVLAFYSTANNPGPYGSGCDVRRVELAFTSSDDGEDHALVRLTTTNLLAPETLELDEEVLCLNVRSFNLSYCDGVEWFDEWDSTLLEGSLPLAVSITLGVDRPGSESDEEDEYRMSALVVLPCYAAPEDEGTRVIGPSTGGGR